MKAVIDTSIFIDYLRVKDKTKTPYQKALSDGVTPVTPLVVYSELYAGKSVWESDKAQEALEKLLSGVAITLPNLEIAKEAGRLRAQHEVQLFDGYIAATALTLEVPVFTLNPKHFKSVPTLSLYWPPSD